MITETIIIQMIITIGGVIVAFVSTRRQVEVLRARLTDVEEENRRLREQNGRLRERVDDLENKLNERDSRYDRLRGRLADVEADNARLRAVARRRSDENVF